MRSSRMPLTVLCVLSLTVVASGAEVRWARSTPRGLTWARERRLPVMMLFRKTDDEWCLKLEDETLSDPRVARLATGFVPIRVDAHARGKLTARLRITRYPTVLFLDGRLNELGRAEGFLNADDMIERMAAALVGSASDRLRGRLTEAGYKDALDRLAEIQRLIAAVMVDAAPAAGKVTDVEALARAQLERAGRLADGGRTEKALDVLVELIRRYPGAGCVEEAKKQAVRLRRRLKDGKAEGRRRDVARARALLQKGKAREAVGDAVEAARLYRLVMTRHPDTDEALLAELQLRGLKENEESRDDLVEAKRRREAERLLNLARSWRDNDRPAEARACYEKLIEQYADTAAAGTAKEEIRKLDPNG